MNRRKFLRTFAAAVATVAIGLRVSQGMPEMLEPIELTAFQKAYMDEFFEQYRRMDAMRLNFGYGWAVINPNATVKIMDTPDRNWVSLRERT